MAYHVNKRNDNEPARTRSSLSPANARSASGHRQPRHLLSL